MIKKKKTPSENFLQRDPLRKKVSKTTPLRSFYPQSALQWLQLVTR